MDEEMDLEMVSPSPQAQPAKKFKVKLKIVGDGLNDLENHQDPVLLKLNCNTPHKRCQADFYDGDKQVLSVVLSNSDQVYQSGDNYILMRISRGSALVQLMSSNDTNQLLQQIQSVLSPGTTRISKQSVFSLRTEEASAKQYFQFYGFLAQQQNMMQDYVRTSTYQSAMLQNTADFKDKVVMDVGAGSGVLSFFAVQAGAKKVYAVEASSMAVHCQSLVQSNRIDNKVTIIAGKVEEIDVPEKVDVIISEPMGYMLFNERMLESFLHAKKWLKPEGKMYPTQAILYCAPFTDDMLYMEQFNKATFWCQQHFHSIDLSALRESAMEEYFKQPIVDTFDMRILLAKPQGHKVDFLHSSEDSLHNISINLSFDTWSSGGLHGLAFWFDVAFIGSQQTVWLSTAPFQPLTHWYQVRCLLKKPLFVQVGQKITGSIMMKANERQSYDIDVELSLVGTTLSTKSSYDLKNPYFRYTGMMPHNVPGSQHSNPTDSYYSSATQVPVPLPDQGLTNGSGYSHYNSSTTSSGTVPSQYNPYSYSGYAAPSGSYLPSTMYGQPIMSTTMVSSGTVPSQNWPDSSAVYPKTPMPRQTIPVVSGRS